MSVQRATNAQYLMSSVENKSNTKILLFSISFIAIFYGFLHSLNLSEHALTIIHENELEKIKQAVLEKRTMLETYWENPKVLTSAFKYDQSQTIEVLANKFASVLVHGENFVVASIGSSVTAGHDNCHYDSWESQLEREMKSIFDVIDTSNFVVENAGITGDCGDAWANQIWCVEHTINPEADTIHYDWTYFSDNPEAHEQFTRWSLLLPGQPVPLITETSANMRDENELFETYKNFGLNYMPMLHGAAVEGLGFDTTWGAIGDGLHTTTRYGENESKERRHSLGVLFRNWHPGPMLFQLYSDTITYQYTSALLAAIEKIRNSSGPTTEFVSKRNIPKANLPDPVLCGTECEVDHPPMCNNLQIPTFGISKITILEPTDDLNPFQREPEESMWYFHENPRTNKIPALERDLEYCAHIDSCAGWRRKSEEFTGDYLTAQIPKLTKGIVMVCFHLGKNKVQDWLDGNRIEIIWNGVKIENLGTRTTKCLEIKTGDDEGNEFLVSEDINYLSIETILPDNWIDHIIAL